MCDTIRLKKCTANISVCGGVWVWVCVYVLMGGGEKDRPGRFLWTSIARWRGLGCPEQPPTVKLRVVAASAGGALADQLRGYNEQSHA